jgi:hypothetical protein
MMVETKIGENWKIQEKQMGWMEDWGKMEFKKLKHEKYTSKEWSVKSSINIYFITVCSFYHTLQKNQRFQQYTSTIASIPNLHSRLVCI